MVTIIVALLGLVYAVSGAAVLQGRQEPAPTVLSACTPIFRYITVTAVAPTVTVAAVDPSSVSNKFATQASIDTIQVIQESQAAPVGFPVPLPQSFTHTATAPLVEATPVDENSDSISVFYIPQGPDGTVEETPVAVTTVIVSPTPAAPPPAPQKQPQVNTTINMTSFRTATTTRYGGWNVSSAPVGTSTAGYGAPAPPLVPLGLSRSLPSSDDSLVTTTTVTHYLSSQTVGVVTKTTASGYDNFSVAGISKLPSTLTAQLVPRQTCFVVDAGPYGTWCNNWDGSQVVSYSTYETTITPTPQSLQTRSVVTVTVTENGSPPPPEAPPPSAAPSSSNAPSSSGIPSPSTVVSPGLNTTAPNQPNGTAPQQPQSCGESGNFTVDFDNLPASGAPDPIIFNPFHHFSWGDYWTYAPPPDGQFLPQGGPHMAVCNSTKNNTLRGSPDAGDVPPGGFGNTGVRAHTDLFWFNAISAYVGCDHAGLGLNDACWLNVWAWKWDGVREYVAEKNAYRVAPCAESRNCPLQEIHFPESWTSLITMNFTATVGSRVRNFYMDSLNLGWVNNTCEAGLKRISVKKRGFTS